MKKVKILIALLVIICNTGKALSIYGETNSGYGGVPSQTILLYSTTGNQVVDRQPDIAITDVSGEYLFDNLLEGTYHILATSATGYINQLYANKPCNEYDCSDPRVNGTPVQLINSFPDIEINFNLTPEPSTISGFVYDKNNGLPLSNIWLEVYTIEGNFIATSATNSQGYYLISSVLMSQEPGEYFLKTKNQDQYIDELYSDIICVGGTCDVTLGETVSVSNETATTNINFQLAKGGIISGTVYDDNIPSVPLAGVGIEVYANTKLVNYIVTNEFGAYETSTGLIDGEYQIATNTNSQEQGNYINEVYDEFNPNNYCLFNLKVSCNGTDITNIDAETISDINFYLGLGGTINGTVTDSLTGNPVGFIQIVIKNSFDQVVSTALTANGKYKTLALPANSYYVNTSNNLGYNNEIFDDIQCDFPCSPSQYLGSNAIQLMPTDNIGLIDFQLNALGKVKGKVVDADGNGLSLITVSSMKINDDGLELAELTISDEFGNFEIKGLFSGDYYVYTASVTHENKIFENYICATNLYCNPLVDGGTVISVLEGATSETINFQLNVLPPDILFLAPNADSTIGGTNVVITGTGFQAGLIVKFNDTVATVSMVTNNQIELLTPAHAEGVVNISVTNPGLQSTTLNNGFTYVMNPQEEVFMNGFEN